MSRFRNVWIRRIRGIRNSGCQEDVGALFFFSHYDTELGVKVNILGAFFLSKVPGETLFARTCSRGVPTPLQYKGGCCAIHGGWLGITTPPCFAFTPIFGVVRACEVIMLKHSSGIVAKPAIPCPWFSFVSHVRI